jgi:hypothetical protein
LPTAAQANSPREAVRVAYAAPSECPSHPVLEAAFAEHLGPATLAEFGELARTLTIVITRQDGTYAARVELTDPSGATASREVSAPTCDQAMNAIALVAALAARAQIEEAKQEEEHAPESTPGVATKADTPREQAAPAATPRIERTLPAPVRREHESARQLEGELLAGAGVASGVGPGLAPGLMAEARLSLLGSFSISAALQLLAHDTFRTSGEAADIRARLIRGRLELCPWEPRLWRRVRLSPCAGFELGSQSGEGFRDATVISAYGASRLWAAGSAAARARFAVGRLTTAFGAELVVPVTRNRFALRLPERPLYRVPAVALGVSTGLGVSW